MSTHLDPVLGSEPDPFTTVYVRALAYERRAHQAARRLLGCDHLADDAVQEAMFALHREATPPPDPGPWLVRATVHRALHLRRTLVRRRRHEAAVGRGMPEGCCDNPLHRALLAEMEQRVQRAIDELRPDQRQLLGLQLDSELDYAGMAAAIGRPIGTVRSRLHRARHALAAALPDLAEPTSQ